MQLMHVPYMEHMGYKSGADTEGYANWTWMECMSKNNQISILMTQPG